MIDFRVIIAGGRDFNDYDILTKTCNNILKTIKTTHNVIIISGVANGADKLGERYGIEKEYTIEKYPADWDRDGKSAGYIRNSKMAEVADALIAFWDGKSKGTKHMINLAKSKDLKVRIINYNRQKGDL